MIVMTELIKSCSHEKVAAAAVASIGSGFQRLIGDAASARNLEVGSYAAFCVRRFAHEAEECDWQDLAQRVEGEDMPILAGLRYILEISLPADLRRISAAVHERHVERQRLWRSNHSA